MYQLVRAVLRKRGKNQTWKEVDVSAMPLPTFLSTYVDGYLELTNAALGPGSYFVDYQTLKTLSLPIANMPVENWVQITTMPVLPTIAEPTFTTTRCLYSNAWQARYRIQRSLPDIPEVTTLEPLEICYPDGEPAATRDMVDLILTKDHINHADLQRFVLVSVNGFYHLAVPNGIALQVRQGAKSVDICGQNAVGLTSLREVGEVQQLPVLPANVYKLSPNQPYKNAMYIDTGIDLTGKSVMVSIGGYLHVEDSVIDIVTPSTGLIKVTFSHLNLVQRYFEMKRYLDVSPLQLTTSRVRPNAVAVEELYSDDVLLRLMQMAQSFVIVVDSPMLHVETSRVGTTGLLGIYEMEQTPLYPLRFPTGRIMEYWRRKEAVRWAINTGDNRVPSYLMHTTPWQGAPVVNDISVPSEFRIVNAHMHAICKTVRS